MKRLTIALVFALGLGVSLPALGQQPVKICLPHAGSCFDVTASNPLPVTGAGGGSVGIQYNLVPPTAVDGATGTLQGDLHYSLKAVPTNLSGTALAPYSTAAAGAPTATSGMLSTGTYNLTPPSFADGQQGSQQFDAHGSTKEIPTDTAGVPIDLTLPVSVYLLPLATGGCTPYTFVSTASTNSQLVSTGTHILCGGPVINTTATIAYLRLYDSVGAPTCSSATGWIQSIPIPASASGAGVNLNFGIFGLSFTNGIGFCITGGGTSTDNTNAVAGVYVNVGYK